MARLQIPVVIPSANDAAEVEIGLQGVLLNDKVTKGGPDGDGYYFVNPSGRTVLLCFLDGSSKSQGTLTIDTIPIAGDTMTIGVAGGSKVYTFRALVDWDVDGEVLIGATLAACQQSIVDAINGDDGVNTAHTQVTAETFNNANKSIITAILPGSVGDTYVTTETFTAGTNVFDGITLGTTTAGGLTGAVTVTVIGVDDPYGRGASPDGDLAYTLTSSGVGTIPWLLGRYSPPMFNQSAVPRTVNVDVTALTGTGKLVALSI